MIEDGIEQEVLIDELIGCLGVLWVAIEWTRVVLIGQAAASAEEVAENIIFDVDFDSLTEKIKIDLDGNEEESIEGEFIDIDSGEEEEDTFGSDLDGQNETGRNFAATSFKKVENQIVDAYDMLADEEDKKIFYDYLLTNLLLYFDKFEDELSTESVETSTPEYEEESAESSIPSGDEESEEVDTSGIS